MPKISWTLTGGLSRDQLDLMHQRALEVLEKVGLEVPHEGVLSILADYQGVSVEKDRVRYKPWLVEEQTRNMTYDKSYDYKVLSGCYSLNILDADTHKIRAANSTDLVKMTKLADSFGMDVVAPVSPQDIPPQVREIFMHKTVYENSSRAISGGVISTVDQAEYIYRMSSLVNKRFALDLWLLSPLRLDAYKLNIIFHFLDRKVPMWVATMPMAGSTGPIFFPSLYIQLIAETLGAATTLKLISKGGEVSYSYKDGFKAMTFDMKYGSMPYGTPEYIILMLLHKQIAAYYSHPFVWKCFGSSSFEPDIQSSIERSANTILAVLAEADGIYNVGVLADDFVYSPEQVVIDNEILNYAIRVKQGYEFNEKTSSIEPIVEVGPGGTFLTHETTLSNFRDILSESELFIHGGLRGPQQSKQREKIREMIQRRISSHTYSLDKEIQKELNILYKKATQELFDEK